MPHLNDYGKFILTYDPHNPQAHAREYDLQGLPATAEEALPDAIPWPSGHAPTARPLSPAPAAAEDLSKFHGYDAVVVTWTSAEAAALSRLFTPQFPVTSWYEYRHNVNAYIQLVTGKDAPFNDTSTEMARYYHSMALYYPCTIGKAKVLLMKSGLHLDYDGPAVPVKKLMAEVYNAVKPRIFITTGTGGAIGSEVLLGDVVIASKARFFCTGQFKTESWANSSFPASALPPGVPADISTALTKGNAARVPGARTNPKFWTGAQSLIVTTDSFCFDDSRDTEHLQGLGLACDMGDAMVADALQPYLSQGLQFFAIRNASDPQIPNPNGDLKAASKQAAQIYAKYGGLTTAASAVATWAVIDTIVNG